MTEATLQPPMASIGATLRLLAPTWRRLVLASLLGALAVAGTVALMGTSAWMLAKASTRPGEAALGLTIVAVQVFGLSRGFARYGERLVGHDAALRLLGDLRASLFDRLVELAPVSLPAFRSGELLAAVVADVDQLQDLVLRVLPPFVVAALVGTGATAAMVVLLPQAGLALGCSMLLAIFVLPCVAVRLEARGDSDRVHARAALAARLVDLVDGASELEAFGATAAVGNEIAMLDAVVRRNDRQAARRAGITLGLAVGLAGASALLCLIFGIVALGHHQLDPLVLGSLVVVPLATFEVVAPLPAAVASFRLARQSAGRLATIMSTPAMREEPQGPPRTPVGTDVSLEALEVTYPDGTWALRGIDLDLPAGSVVGIVGRSGAGKSTLGLAIAGAMSPTAGHARLGECSTTALSAAQLHGLVGCIEQQPVIFDASLRDNLRLARRDATDADLVRALDEVGLGGFLEELSQGLDARLGPQGVVPSGGQLQRLAVARARLAAWPITIYDEPAEHLDEDAARAMTALLTSPNEGRTTVLITHRLEGLEAVDQVLVVDQGRCIEQGTPAALLAAGGAFAARLEAERSHRNASTPTIHPRTRSVA